MLPILLIAGGLIGQPQPARDPQPAATSQPLAGPAVAPHVTRPTLVAYDLNGRLRRSETQPELAALALLHLPPDAQARADAVIADRVAAIDAFVSDNLLLFGQIDSASKAGRKLDAALLIAEAFDKVRPILRTGTLRDRLIRALPPEHAERFRAIFDEYWGAVVGESLRDSRSHGKHDARWQVDLGERFNHLGQEIGRSYERQAAAGTIFIDYLLAGLDLTADQRRIIREFKLDMLERTGFRPSEDDQKRLGLSILAYLTQSQRLKVLKKIGG